MILIDYREDERFIREFKPFGDTECIQATLPFGDIAFVGNGPEGPITIGFERKTIHNLCSSIRSDQLGGFQLLGMLETYPHAAYLLVEGIWQAGQNGEIRVRSGKAWVPLHVGSTGFHFREVDHFLATMEEAGLRVLRTASMAESAATIISRYKWWNDKPYNKHKAHRSIYAPIPVKPNPNGGNKYRFIRPEKPNLVTKMAAQIDGIEQKAWKVGEYFKTPGEMVTATEEDWRKALGFKKSGATVKRIIEEMLG